MTPNVITIHLDWQTVLVWAVVGLVAGFLASHVMLGHGMGIFGDMVIGIIGGIGAPTTSMSTSSSPATRSSARSSSPSSEG